MERRLFTFINFFLESLLSGDVQLHFAVFLKSIFNTCLRIKKKSAGKETTVYSCYNIGYKLFQTNAIHPIINIRKNSV